MAGLGLRSADDGGEIAHAEAGLGPGTGGRERGETEYRALLEAAGFALERVQWTPAGIDVMVARPVAAS